MIIYTADMHGDIGKLKHSVSLTFSKDDTIVILGDVNANFFGDARDYVLKFRMNELGRTILCIHGNHEMRPEKIPSYQTKIWNNGIVYYEEAYPNILFAADGEVYDIDGISHLVIGGAVSPDKEWRIANRLPYFADEAPSPETKAAVEARIAANPSVDVVLTHTCPASVIPEAYLLPSGTVQGSVDRSTEQWLDSIASGLNFRLWLCGHFHIDADCGKYHFLYSRCAMYYRLHKQKDGFFFEEKEV